MNNNNNNNNKLPRQPYFLMYPQPNTQQIQYTQLTPIDSQSLLPFINQPSIALQLLGPLNHNQFTLIPSININGNNLNNKANNNQNKLTTSTMDSMNTTNSIINSNNNNTNKVELTLPSLAIPSPQQSFQLSTSLQNINHSNNSNTGKVQIKLPPLTLPPQQQSFQLSKLSQNQLSVNANKTILNLHSNDNKNSYTDKVEIKLPSSTSPPQQQPHKLSSQLSIPSALSTDSPFSSKYTINNNRNNDLNTIDQHNQDNQPSSSFKPQKRKRKKKNRKNKQNKGWKTDPSPNQNGKMEISIQQMVRLSTQCPLCGKAFYDENGNDDALKKHYKNHYINNTETTLVSGQYLQCPFCLKIAVDEENKEKQEKLKRRHSHIGNLISHLATHKQHFSHPYQCKIKTYNPDKQKWIQCSYDASTQQNVVWHAYKSHFRDIYDTTGEYDCTVKHGYHLKRWAKDQEKKKKKKKKEKRNDRQKAKTIATTTVTTARKKRKIKETIKDSTESTPTKKQKLNDGKRRFLSVQAQTNFLLLLGKAADESATKICTF